MSEQGKSSIRINNDATAKVAAWLLANYYFDLSGYQPCELVDSWLNYYPANWLRLAVIEALYQGRYKAVSVEQILIIWHRRKQALYHFNYEFETLICSKLPPELTQLFSSGVSNPSPPPSFPQSEPTTSDSELEAEEESSPISSPFEVFAQSFSASITADFPPTETQETETELFSPTEPLEPSDLDEEYQTMICEEEYFYTENYTDDYGDYSDRFSNHYPFPDIFMKLRSLALQHQQLINQRQPEI